MVRIAKESEQLPQRPQPTLFCNGTQWTGGRSVASRFLDFKQTNKQTEKRETTKKTRNAKNATTATAKTTIHEQMPEEMKRNEMKIKEDKNRN